MLPDAWTAAKIFKIPHLAHTESLRARISISHLVHEYDALPQLLSDGEHPCELPLRLPVPLAHHGFAREMNHGHAGLRRCREPWKRQDCPVTEMVEQGAFTKDPETGLVRPPYLMLIHRPRCHCPRCSPMTLAIIVFPHPGGPSNSRARGIGEASGFFLVPRVTSAKMSLCLQSAG